MADNTASFTRLPPRHMRPLSNATRRRVDETKETSTCVEYHRKVAFYDFISLPSAAFHYFAPGFMILPAFHVFCPCVSRAWRWSCTAVRFLDPPMCEARLTTWLLVKPFTLNQLHSTVGGIRTKGSFNE